MLVAAYLPQHEFRHVCAADFNSTRGQKIDGCAVFTGSGCIH
jgi:hypothetical protein